MKATEGGQPGSADTQHVSGTKKTERRFIRMIATGSFGALSSSPLTTSSPTVSSSGLYDEKRYLDLEWTRRPSSYAHFPGTPRRVYNHRAP